MKASAESDRRGNSKDDPVCDKIADILDSLSVKVITCSASRFEISSHATMTASNEMPLVTMNFLSHKTTSMIRRRVRSK
jgi:hypothetical protein